MFKVGIEKMQMLKLLHQKEVQILLDQIQICSCL